MREEFTYSSSLFHFDWNSGIFHTTYSTLSHRGNKPVFMRGGEYGFNFHCLYLRSDKTGVTVRFNVRKTYMKKGRVVKWLLTPTKYWRDKVPGCDGTIMFIHNDWV